MGRGTRCRSTDPEGHILAIVRDLAERKRFEAVLVERKRELEAANAELRLAGQYKDQFLVALSHELRTPISTIIGFAEFLADEIGGPMTPDQQGFVHEIEGATQGLLSRVDDMLDFARLQADAFHLDFQEVDLALAVRETAEAMRSCVEGAGHAYDVECPGGGVRGVADGRQLQRVVSKLFDNASNFTPQGARSYSLV